MQCRFWVTRFHVLVFPERAGAAREVEFDIVGKLETRNASAVASVLGERHFRIISAVAREMKWCADVAEVVNSGIGAVAHVSR